jgi:hypothetical protein
MQQIYGSSRPQMNIRPNMLDNGWTGDHDRIGRGALYCHAAHYGRGA